MKLLSDFTLMEKTENCKEKMAASLDPTVKVKSQKPWVIKREEKGALTVTDGMERILELNSSLKNNLAQWAVYESWKMADQPKRIYQSSSHETDTQFSRILPLLLRYISDTDYQNCMELLKFGAQEMKNYIMELFSTTHRPYTYHRFDYVEWLQKLTSIDRMKYICPGNILKISDGRTWLYLGTINVLHVLYIYVSITSVDEVCPSIEKLYANFRNVRKLEFSCLGLDEGSIRKLCGELANALNLGVLNTDNPGFQKLLVFTSFPKAAMLWLRQNMSPCNPMYDLIHIDYSAKDETLYLSVYPEEIVGKVSEGCDIINIPSIRDREPYHVNVWCQDWDSTINQNFYPDSILDSMSMYMKTLKRLTIVGVNLTTTYLENAKLDLPELRVLSVTIKWPEPLNFLLQLKSLKILELRKYHCTLLEHIGSIGRGPIPILLPFNVYNSRIWSLKPNFSTLVLDDFACTLLDKDKVDENDNTVLYSRYEYKRYQESIQDQLYPPTPTSPE